MENNKPGIGENRTVRGLDSPPLSSADLSVWREQLFRYICAASAVVHITVSVIYWVTQRTHFEVLSVTIFIGIVSGILPFATFLTVRKRCWLLCLAFLISLTAILLGRGYSPAFTGGYFLILLTTGLLLGRAAMILGLVLGLAAFFIGGYAINAGLLAIEPVGHDPNVMRNWIDITIVFGAICLAIVLIVRFATRVVNDLYASAHRGLAHAQQLRETARRVRDKRLAVERQLRSTQKLQAVDQLSGGLSHLFNNALTVVRSALETVQANPSSLNRMRTPGRISAALERTLQVTSDLMVFSRPDEPAVETIELADELINFADNLAHAVPGDVSLLFNSAQGLEVPIGPKQLRQMLLNLVLNASDAVRGSGNVQITAALFKDPGESEISRAVFAIEDNGCGMDSEMLIRAADPFFTTKGGHSGLGLSVAHAIANQVGGEMRIQSEEGVGTRILVLLPLASPIAVVDADPSDIWPTAHVLHSGLFGRHHEPEERDESLPEAPILESAWQDKVTRQLARIATITVAVTVALSSPFVPHMHSVYIWAGLPAVALMAIAGWSPRLPRRLALLLLAGGLSGLGLAMVFPTSFNATSSMALLIVAIGWTALLGGRWDGIAALLLIIGALILIGYLRSGPFPMPITSNADMNLAANWFRLGSQLTVAGIAMAFSIVGVLSQAHEGALAEVAAFERVEAMRRHELEEGARLLEIEGHLTRSERSAVAGQAAGRVAHDLRNAVHALLMSSELLAIDNLSEERIATAVSELNDAVLYAEAIATQFDSVKASDVKGDYPLCELSSNVDAMVALLRRVIPTDIELIADIEPMTAIRINETDLRRLLFNLVTNARDAIADNGTITVSLSVQSNVAVLRVSDTGCGMDKDTRKRCFDAFFTTKESGMGTGLGLHLVADIVQRTKGEITVDTDVGRGTSFAVSWPAEKPPVPTQRRAEPLSFAQGEGAVLLVEDELGVRMVMAEAIRSAGFKVIEASDGDQGKELALQGTGYVAACIDGVIPGAPSSEVISCFLQTHPGCPVLLCSGYMPDDLASRGLLRAGVTLLAKPFGPNRLRKELEAVIRTAREAS